MNVRDRGQWCVGLLPWRAALVVCALAALMAGCGDDGSGTSEEDGTQDAHDVMRSDGIDTTARDTTSDTTSDTTLDVADTAPDTVVPPTDTTDVSQRGPVTFISTPVLEARVGVAYTYFALAQQASSKPGDTLTYAVAAGPAGMTINAATGAVGWTPAAGDDGDHQVDLTATGPDGQSATQSFTVSVAAAVTITGIHPAAGTARGGETVTVSGAGFDGPGGALQVVVGNQTPITPTLVDANTLEFTTLPSVARTSAVAIRVDGVEAAREPLGFTYLPTIDVADADAIDLYATFTVDGAGYDSTQLLANVLTVPAAGGTDRRLVASDSPNGTDLTFAFGIGNSESSIATGAVAVITNGLQSNWVPLTINDSALQPEMAVTSFVDTGSTLQLEGAGFAGLPAYDGTSAYDLANPTALLVMFAGAANPAAVNSISADGTMVDVSVPADAVTGPVELYAPGLAPQRSKVAAQIATTTAVLSVLEFTPEGGVPGTVVVLRGTGFEPAAGATSVSFEGVDARILSVEPDRLVVELPSSLSFGAAEIAVTVGADVVSAGTFAVTGSTNVIAGGAASSANIGDGAAPTLVLMGAGFVATDAANNLYIADGPRVRVANTTASTLSAYGITVAAGTVGSVVNPGGTGAANVSAIAIHPVTEDLYYAAGPQIFRVRRANGTSTVYAGTSETGFGGDGGFRLNASFSDISDLRFTTNAAQPGTFLVIADNNNGWVRAINTTGTAATLWGVTIGPELVDGVEQTGGANPMGLSLDADDNLFVSQFRYVYRINWDRATRVVPFPPGYVRWEVIAGSGAAVFGTGCPATTVPLGTNDGLAVDPVTNEIYVGSRHALIRRVYDDGSGQLCVEHVAGNLPAGSEIANIGFAGDGGPALDAHIALFARPFLDRNGQLLIAGDGRIRRVTINSDGTPGNIETVAGIGPMPLVNGTNALGVQSVDGAVPVIRDAARQQLVYAVQGRLVAHDTATNQLSIVAGTGVAGNKIAAGNDATQSNLGVMRGVALAANDLYVLESVIPRVSKVNLDTLTLSVVAGDGISAIAADQTTVGPAIDARVMVNTGTPKAAIGPSGGLYFGDEGLIRVINVTSSAISTFGVTVQPGDIDVVAGTAKGNISAVTFDAAGNLFFASYTSNALWVKRDDASASYPVEEVGSSVNARFGFNGPGRLADLRLNRPADLAFLPSGDLLIANNFGTNLVLVELDPGGQFSADSRTLSVFGNGANGNVVPALGAHATPGRVYSTTVDGQDLLIHVGGRLVRLTMP